LASDKLKIKIMSEERKPDVKRGEMAFIFAIVIGLALGILIKRVKVGILIGIVLGFVIVLTGWLRTTRK
jgi:hypothetical protein